MKELPKGWVHIPFDEAVEAVSDRGLRIKQKNYLSSGKIPVVDQGEGLVGGYTEESSYIVTEPPPLIVFGDHTRRFKLIKFHFAVGADGVKILKPIPIWNSDFLFHQLKNINIKYRGYGRHYQYLRQELIAFPPRAEQTRIVAKLEELLTDLEHGVAELKAAQKKLGQYRQSLLKAAVEGQLTAHWRAQQQQATACGQAPETGAQLLARILTERRQRWEAKQLAKFAEQGKTPPKNWQSKYPEPVQPDTTDLPELPQGWVWASLDALIVDGPQNGIYLPGNKYGSGTAILRIDDYQIGWHRDRSTLNLVEASANEIASYAVNTGDIIINRVNSMTHLGKSLLISEKLNGVIFESNMMRLRLSPEVSSDLVVHYLGSDFGRARLIQDAKWAVNQASINQQDVRRTPIPLMSASEQNAISQLLVQQLLAANEQESSIVLALKQAAAQRQNILRAAFAGELVPQDPNDEPASVLLERIRAERAAQAAAAGKKPKTAPRKKAQP